MSAPIYQSSSSTSGPAGWDNSALIVALNNLTLQQGGWVMDSGASSHMSPDDGNISSPTPLSSPHFVTVGNGHTIPITSSGHTSMQTPLGHTFKLNHILLVLTLIRNVLSACKFTHDSCCSIDCHAFGFSVKDLKTHHVILRCNSDGELYTFLGIASTRRAPPTAFVATATSELWHQRLGHPGQDVMLSLHRLAFIKFNKVRRPIVCVACLPFNLSTSRSSSMFDLIHCDLWTSPIISISGF
jgi:hypothetical protein